LFYRRFKLDALRSSIYSFVLFEYWEK